MLRPQDVVVALKLLWAGEWTFPAIARQLHMNQSDVFYAVKRLTQSRLYDQRARQVQREKLLEFIVHGLPYAFPASFGPVTRGVPTAISAAPLFGKIVSGDDYAMVWPAQDGEAFGRAIDPLHKHAPNAAMDDAQLHQCLALIDALRVGRARERTIAREELKKRIVGENP